MPTAQYGVSLTAGGVSIQKAVNRTADNPIALETSISAGKTCTSWVKTDANTAACDLPGGHGYSNGNFDCFWTESSLPKARYGVPGTISTNALSLDGGAGDDFPANGTTVICCRQTSANMTIDGDNCSIIGVCAESTDASSTTAASIMFVDGSSNTIAQLDLVANIPQVFDFTGGATNILTGAIIESVKLGAAGEALTLKIVGMQDATP